MNASAKSRARAISDLRRFTRAAKDAAAAIRDMQDALSTLAGQLSFGIIEQVVFDEEDKEEEEESE